ncbi:hypothetical protein [Fictibacillus enclensis]|uniref:hypothetical protein n=1 Tax=Fictibacillus enclensis TaxID=1017270 RepID=UPI0025A1FA1C|nr:hypothetical protein [Fictibacillus enclensis]
MNSKTGNRPELRGAFFLMWRLGWVLASGSLLTSRAFGGKKRIMAGISKTAP